MGLFRLFLPFDGIAANRYQSAFLFYPAATPKGEKQREHDLGTHKGIHERNGCRTRDDRQTLRNSRPTLPRLARRCATVRREKFCRSLQPRRQISEADSWRMAASEACGVGRRNASGWHATRLAPRPTPVLYRAAMATKATGVDPATQKMNSAKPRSPNRNPIW